MYLLVLLSFQFLVSYRLVQSSDIAPGSPHVASISIIINNSPVHLNVSASDNIPEIASNFCLVNGITNDRCSHFVSVELWDSLWCTPGQKRLAQELGVSNIPRTFRFLHHPHYLDSEEFSLLRPRFMSNGWVECTSGMDITGEEDGIWLLGHIDGGVDEEGLPTLNQWPFTSISSQTTSTTNSSLWLSSSSSFMKLHSINAFPISGHLGDKDTMSLNLDRLSTIVGDHAIKFSPRTWQTKNMNSQGSAVKFINKTDKKNADGHDSEKSMLNGIWVQKDPQKELGLGIALIEGEKVGKLAQCKECVLQRYVEDPMLLYGRKFSVGMYTTVTNIDPLITWTHKELLVLLCTRQYEPSKNNASEALAHLSNGLLNRRLNENEASECQGCEYNATDQVWTSARLLEYMDQHNIEWPAIELQMRRIALTTLTSAYDKMTADVHTVKEDLRQKMFAHWRFDFLFDASGGVWLLEAEIVPSTGTIGGVDEVIKSVVLRDLFSLVGWGPSIDSSNNIEDRPSFDKGLCQRQTPGSHAEELCYRQLLTSPYYHDKDFLIPEIEHALQNQTNSNKEKIDPLKRIVKEIYKSNGDSLYLNDRAVELSVEWERQYHRRGSYEPLSPSISRALDVKKIGEGSTRRNNMKSGETGWRFVNGQSGYYDEALTTAEKIFLFNKGTFSDTALWRYLISKYHKYLSSTVDTQNKGVGSVISSPHEWNTLPVLTVLEAYEQCLACVQTDSLISDRQYCVSVTSSHDRPPQTIAMRGQCQEEWDTCIHRPSGFVDGVALKSPSSCEPLLSLFKLDETPLIHELSYGVIGGDGDGSDMVLQVMHLLKAMKVNVVNSYRTLVQNTCSSYHRLHAKLKQKKFERFCDNQDNFINENQDERRSSQVSDTKDSLEEHEEEVGHGGGFVSEMSVKEFIKEGGIGTMFGTAPLPKVVRAGPCEQGWEASDIKQSFGDIEVNALLFDPLRDSAQELFTANMNVNNFVDWALDPTLFVAETMSNASLTPYLLLTTRHFLESSAHSTATSPNAKLMAKGGRFLDLVEGRVDAMFQSRGVGRTGLSKFEEGREGEHIDEGNYMWDEGWTSLRLGGRYTYPTHIDCFENIILQLSGDKRVRLLPPFAVDSVRPDPNHKHWPQAEHQVLEQAFAQHGWIADLKPGDMLYVPLLWFHSVEVNSDWSITANRYFFMNENSDENGGRWKQYAEGKKPEAWVKYEQREGLKLC